MNYIKQLNAFYDWVLLNPITPKQQALYLAILNLNNKAGWIKEFTIANQTLQAVCPMGKSDLHKTRNELKKIELIEYKKGKKGQAGSYSIVPLYRTNMETNVETNMDTNMETNMETNARDITKQKQNETKKHTKEISDAFETIWAEYPKKVDKQAAFKKFKSKVKQDGLHIVIDGTRGYIKQVQRQGTDKQFIKHYTTFLNKESYKDDFNEQPQHGGRVLKNFDPNNIFGESAP